MAEPNCKAQFVTAVHKFREMVHVDGENAYKDLITELKEISLKFVDDLDGANVPTVLKSIRRRDGHHFQRSLSVRHEHVQQRFDPYAVHDKGWDEETEQLVTEIFKLIGDASEILKEVYRKIAILKSKVRQVSFLKVINAIPLPTTIITVLNRMEPEFGLDVDKERIHDHMPQLAFLEASPLATKLLGALTHFVMRNNLLRKNDSYSIKRAETDFKTSYTVLKRVLSGVKQKGGSYYEKRSAGQKDDKATPEKKRRTKEVAEEQDTQAEVEVEDLPCKYCGKSFKTEERWTQHMAEKHPSEKNIFSCPYCTEPFNRYIRYIDHLSEHKDKVIKCKVCNKVCKTLTELGKHKRLHVNQCSFCAENFSREEELVNHVDKEHKEESEGIERQCSLREATFNTLQGVTEHYQQVHRPHGCNICFVHFAAEHELLAHRQEVHKITNPGANVSLHDPSDQPPEPPTKTGDGANTQQPAGNQGDRSPRSGEQEEPKTAETPKKDKELKGHKKQSEVFTIECEACNRYFRDWSVRRNHIRGYHQIILRKCNFCDRSYLDPWDWTTHMDNKHVWCELCRGYTRDQKGYESHCREKHEKASKSPKKATKEPDKEPEKEPTPEPPGSKLITDISESQVSEGAATTETDREDRPFKCKHCKRRCKTAAEMNMHINRRHRIHKCTDCDKHFLKEEDRVNHRADIHKHPRFHCKIKKCDVYAHNMEELHRHMRDKHWSKFHFRCCKCPYLFAAREGLDRHLEKMHSRSVLKDDGSVTFKCTKCSREFRAINMYIDHSRDHAENIYKCRECRWCFASLERLHAHCMSTHNTMYNACSICGTDFPTNDDLYHHMTRDHVVLCHICHESFVSEVQLQGHLEEAHTKTPANSREQMIDEERAKEHEEKERRKWEKKRKRKKKKKKEEEDNDDDDKFDDSTYYPSKDQGDISEDDPEWLPSKRALRKADEEGDEDDDK